MTGLTCNFKSSSIMTLWSTRSKPFLKSAKKFLQSSGLDLKQQESRGGDKRVPEWLTFPEEQIASGPIYDPLPT
jgi:hypothetical protein